MDGKHRTTIGDVATEAGVSISTVSRVINDNYPVSSKTRVKVEKAIKKLKFNPNMVARSLIAKKTNTVGIVVPGITNMFFTMVVKGIENACRLRNYTILLSDSEGDGHREVECVQNLISRQVDGIVIADPVTENMIRLKYDEIAQHTALVFINGYAADSNMNYVLNDESEGALKALEYLIGLGHKDIRLIRGNRSYSYDIKENVYRDTMAEHKLAIGKQSIINVGDGNSVETVDNASKVVYSILKGSVKPTAFFACNDLMAVGALNGCKKAGVVVPDDISIIGFDGIMISEISEPKLTTVDQNMFELGNRSALMLIDIIENNAANGQKIVLKTQLKLRDSCSPPKC